MKKILITGGAGFVGYYFIKYLEDVKEHADILCLDLNAPGFHIPDSETIKVRFIAIDLLNNGDLRQALTAFQPEYILHLASFSSVGFSWQQPSLSFLNNMNIFLNLMEIIRENFPDCRILSVGSSEQYGNVTREMIPLREEYPLAPLSPYAVARVSQEHLSKVYSDGYGLDVVMTRSFNHIGPAQRDIFVIPSFARQLVEIKKGEKDARLVTGDTRIIRDFLDVRDVVDAYYRLFFSGKKGEVYNVCSGRGFALKEVIDMMCDILGIRIEMEVDPKLVRPNDNRVIIGANDKLKRATGWEPQWALKDSLADVIDYWMKK